MRPNFYIVLFAQKGGKVGNTWFKTLEEARRFRDSVSCAEIYETTEMGEGGRKYRLIQD